MSWFGLATNKAALYETMVRAYAPDMYRFAFWLCRDRNVAEDLVQETCLRAWKNWQNLNDVQASKQWLFTILRREHARLYQTSKLMLVDMETDELEDLVSYDAMPELELNDMLEQLPVTYREPLLLQVVGGFSCLEIAAMVDTTEAAVMARVSRARRMLRELLQSPDVRREKLK
jgi:RNA polymerase sigma-70 factor, ECF subfamily